MGDVASFSLPDGSKYTVAVQNPNITFRDARLRAARPALDRHGLPIVSAGGFAVAYRLDSPTGSWAVRCFTRMTDGLEHRYEHVSRFLRDNPSPHWLPTEFIVQGLRVGQYWWPVTLMPWIEGLSLNEWTAVNLANPAALASVREALERIVEDLESVGAAHGDLQHGNLLVAPDGRLVLIDYDGMFVPALANETMPEAGHPNYQHPRRGTMVFGPALDRFSAAVIWSALRALETSPGLWTTFDDGENMLFTGKDFSNPAGSPLMLALRSSSSTKLLADAIERLVYVSPDRLPRLRDFIAGNLPEPDAVPINLGAIAPFPVVDLRRTDALGRVGQRVIAVGEIIQVIKGNTRRGEPYLFLLMGARNVDRLKIVLWSETLARFTAAERLGLAVGRIVGVTGLLSQFDGSDQIVLERPVLLERLNELRVRDLLGSGWQEDPPKREVAAELRIGDVVEHQLFGQGVVLSIRRDVATIRFSVEVKGIAFRSYPLRLIRRAPPATQGPTGNGPIPSPIPRSSPAAAGGTTFDKVNREWGQLIQSAAEKTGPSSMPPGTASSQAKSKVPVSPITLAASPTLPRSGVVLPSDRLSSKVAGARPGRWRRMSVVRRAIVLVAVLLVAAAFALVSQPLGIR